MTVGRALAVDTGGQRLSGTLTLPDGAGPHPAALLLPGSGPINRDGDHRRLPLGIQRHLAAALAGAGIAVARYDRRGVGESSGEFLRTGFHDNVDDAAAVLAALRDDPAVDARRLFLVGHSEGALTAVALAARGLPVAGLVLLSAPGRTGAEVLRGQAGRLLPTLPAPVRLVLRLTRTDLVAKVARIDAPVLALTGDKDLQTDPADLPVIAAHVGGPVQTGVLPDVTHVLRRQPGPPSLRAYRDEAKQPLDPSVVEPVLSWLAARSG